MHIYEVSLVVHAHFCWIKDENKTQQIYPREFLNHDFQLSISSIIS